MKKCCLFIILILTGILMSGCTKNYETVNEYRHSLAKKMQHPSYIIEVKQIVGDKETNYRTYIIDEKWRTDKLSNKEDTYEQTKIYDGRDLLFHDAGAKVATLNYGVEDVDRNDKNRELMINQKNPTDGLFHWGNEYNSLNKISNFNPVFINQNDKRNGYPCRLININENKEVCVSDKYGIAVYEKTINKSNDENKEPTITDVTNITIKYIPFSTFELPEGIRKKKISEL